MKQVFTLLAVGMLCLLFKTTNAQVTVDFNTGFPPGTCWVNNSFKIEGAVGNQNRTTALSGRAAGYASMITPFIIFSANGTRTITFNYATTTQRAPTTLQIKVSLINQTGSIIPISTVNPVGKNIQTYTSPAIPAGTYRVQIEYLNNGNAYGNEYADIDNLTISGNFDDAYPCNSAPNAVDDTYTSTSIVASVSGAVLPNDSDPNNEVLSVVSFTQPAGGTVTMDAAGLFSFVPNASFTGGVVTFTYTITDNALTPLQDVATVTLTYPTAPVAIDDTFTGVSVLAPVLGNITLNDTKPNNKTLAASLVRSPASGTLIFDADGTFTYTPPKGFTGGVVTFTYMVTDEAYAPLNSNVATVSLDIIAAFTLPIKLVAFTGSQKSGKVTLAWTAAENETGLLFEVQRSDGSAYQSVATVFTSEKVGEEEYRFSDAAVSGRTSYRLKIVNKDGTIAYSTVITFETNRTDEKVVLLQNPVQSMLRFKVPAGVTISNIAVYNPAGLIVYTQKTGGEKNNNAISLPLQTNLPQGTYILQVVTTTGTQSLKFTKQ